MISDKVMDTTAIITLAALGLALGMVWITARLLREERRRSAARVAALTAASATTEPDFEETTREEVARRIDRTLAPARTPSPPLEGFFRAEPTPASADATRVRPKPAQAQLPSNDLDLYPETVNASLAGNAMFGATTATGRRGSFRPAVVSFGALVIAAAVSLLLWTKASAPAPTSVDARGMSQASAATPLELVALRHRREGDRLAISGIIKNPAGAPAMRNVSAVVFLFDQAGAFLSSGRAPIDFTTLGPGDESPFVVVVNEPGAVSRYRVSFRADEQVVPHVDRRAPDRTKTDAPAAARATPERPALVAGIPARPQRSGPAVSLRGSGVPS
jgi:hypothetical protein